MGKRAIVAAAGVAFFGALPVVMSASDSAAAPIVVTHDHAMMAEQAAGTNPRAPLNARTLKVMRDSTAPFHNLATAQVEGYGLLRDKDGITCIDMPGVGGMGVHFVKGELVADPAIDPKKPEALVYAPDRDGTLRLAALEYIVDKAAWDKTHTARPRLFDGRPFDLTTAPNRFGLDPFYSQHVWVWKHNRAGTLNMWNPQVVC